MSRLTKRVDELERLKEIASTYGELTASDVLDVIGEWLETLPEPLKKAALAEADRIFKYKTWREFVDGARASEQA